MSATVDAETNLRIFRFTAHPEDTPTGTCDVCDSLDGVEVEERLVGGAFPNAEQIDENSYEVHVHGKCACTLDLVEDDQAKEPEASPAKPSIFSYWQEKEAKRENIEAVEASATQTRFAYWKNTPEQKEAKVEAPNAKKGVARPKQVAEVKPLSKPKKTNAPGEPAQETNEPTPPEKLSINKAASPKFYSSPGEEHEKPTSAAAVTEEINPSELKMPKEIEALPQPEPHDESTLAYWPMQPALSTPEPSSKPEPTAKQHQQLGALLEQKPLGLPEPETPLETNVFSQPMPKRVVKAPGHYFSYWPQGHMANDEPEALTKPEPNTESTFAYRPTQPAMQSSELYSNNEPTAQQPEHQPLGLPESEKPPVVIVPSQPKPKRIVKPPAQYFSYWAQGRMPNVPNAEPEAQLPQMQLETENVTQYGYYAQPTFDAESLEKTFAESKVSEEVVESVAPKVAHKMAKFAYWNPMDANASAEDENDVEENVEEKTGDEGEYSFAAVPGKLKLNPRRVLHAFKNVRNLEKIGLHTIASSGGLNPATAAIASILMPLITELVRVEVELQLQAHNKQIERERNAEYRAAYASVTPL